MSQPQLSTALAKFLSAAMLCRHCDRVVYAPALRDLLYLLPDIEAESWQSINCLLQGPEELHAVERSFHDLRLQLILPESHAEAAYALKQVLPDAEVTSEQVSGLIRHAISGEMEAAVAEATALLLPAVRHRMSVVEDELGDPFKFVNWVNERTDHWRRSHLVRDFEARDMTRLSLVGMLLAHVVNADGKAADPEIEAWQRYLRRHWGISLEAAAFVIQVSLDDELSEADLLRVARWYYELTSLDERIELIRMCFEICLCDSALSDGEIEAVTQIAANLHLSQDTFHEAFTHYSKRTDWPLDAT
jgi:uncharacterized tellurite resistance protein B-like protein